MANVKTSELDALTSFSDGDLFNVSEDQGGGSYLSKKGSFQTLKSDVSTLAVSTKVTTYILTSADDVILADATGGGFTLTLPAAATVTGKIFRIKKINVGNTVTVDGNGSETIDGSLSLNIVTQYTSLTIVSDGSNWHII